MRVAIIGSGITGLAAARALAGHDVTIFEAAGRPGGHVYTFDAGGAKDGVRVDLGFIVHNRDNYPRFCAMLDELGVATRPTTMSFSVSHDGLEWGSESVSAVFAQRWRALDPRHYKLLADVLALLRRMRTDIAGDGSSGTLGSGTLGSGALGGDALGWGTVGDASLDDYLAARHVSRDVRERFVVPLAAALWSLAPDRCGEFPAVTFIQFLAQHGMLSPTRPLAWRTITGGSRRYVDALLARLRVDLRLRTPVKRIERAGRSVERGDRSIERGDRSLERGDRSLERGGRSVERGGAVLVDGEPFDRAIVCTHADTALALLAHPTPQERRVLGSFRYSTNRTVLHTDRSFLPRARAAHASWNYVADPDSQRVNVTYSMTRLQGLPDAPYLVTLNPRREPRGILHEVTFAHPQFDRIALAAQHEVAQLPGPVQFAGAHTGFGFHEDGMRSGELAAARVTTMPVAADRGSNIESVA